MQNHIIFFRIFINIISFLEKSRARKHFARDNKQQVEKNKTTRIS